MANEPIYECTQCKATPGRDLLTVKKAVFLEMGMGGRIIRSRVTDWLCPSCTAKDPDYRREAFTAPGTKRVPVVVEQSVAEQNIA